MHLHHIGSRSCAAARAAVLRLGLCAVGLGVVAASAQALCTDSTTPIYTVQGAGAAAAMTGLVSVKGVVIGDFEGASPALRGFYIQDPVGDGDPATSDALFVFNGNNNNVSVGQLVRVTGTAAEFQDQTQISSVTSLELCGTGSVLPVDVSLPFANAADAERFEGMLVRLPQTLTVTEHFQLGRFGQVLLSVNGRLQQPTHAVAPGASALALQEQSNLARIILDDAQNGQNPDPIVFGRGGLPLSAANTLRGGDTVAGVVGVMTYTWAGNAASGNAWRVRPLGALGGAVPNFSPTNSRPGQAPLPVGSLRVVAFNVLNFFNNVAGCTGGEGAAAMDCRGAGSDVSGAAAQAAQFAVEYPRQLAKTATALVNR